MPGDAFDLAWTEEGDRTETGGAKQRPLGGSFLRSSYHIYIQAGRTVKSVCTRALCATFKP